MAGYFDDIITYHGQEAEIAAPPAQMAERDEEIVESDFDPEMRAPSTEPNDSHGRADRPRERVDMAVDQPQFEKEDEREGLVDPTSPPSDAPPHIEFHEHKDEHIEIVNLTPVTEIHETETVIEMAAPDAHDDDANPFAREQTEEGVRVDDDDENDRALPESARQTPEIIEFEPDLRDETPQAPSDQNAALLERLSRIERELAEARMREVQGARDENPVLHIKEFEPRATPREAAPAPKEIVKEIIRETHHTHEIRTQAPSAPAPRSAAEASRIGEIRFAARAGYWRDGGGG